MLTTRLRGGSLAPFNWPELSRLRLLEPSIRIEEYVEDDRYVVRAELPGVDPARDIDITYAEGTLRLSVVRGEEHREKGRTEFRYGSFHRAVPLPGGAKTDTITAKYAHGILEITMLVEEPEATGKHIPVSVGNGSVKPAKKA